MRLLLTFIFIFVFNLNFTHAEQSEEKVPTVTTKQFRDWTLRCVTENKKQKCEIVQFLQVKNLNLQFTVVYSEFLNNKNELKELINIITPLGVNVQRPASIKFHKGTAVNLPFIKCEVVGCIISISNDTTDPAIESLFKQIKEAMKKSIYFEILVDGFREKPFLIKSSLQGFEDALTEFEKQKN